MVLKPTFARKAKLSDDEQKMKAAAAVSASRYGLAKKLREERLEAAIKINEERQRRISDAEEAFLQTKELFYQSASNLFVALSLIINKINRALRSPDLYKWIVYIIVLFSFIIYGIYLVGDLKQKSAKILASEYKKRPNVIVNLEQYLINRSSIENIDVTKFAVDVNRINDQYTALMNPHPDPDLIQDTPQGFIPIISEDGRQAYQVYARPFDVLDARPKIAIMIDDVGLDQETTKKVLNLSSAVTLSFSAYTPYLSQWIKHARDSGHEVLISIPMEPSDFPYNDPGPLALLNSLSELEFESKFIRLMSLSSGYVGFTTSADNNILTKPALADQLLKFLKLRGLMLIEPTELPQTLAEDIAGKIDLPYLKPDLSILNPLMGTDIDFLLQKAELQALKTGKSFIVVRSHPNNLVKVKNWIDRLLQRGITLIPATALIREQQSIDVLASPS